MTSSCVSVTVFDVSAVVAGVGRTKAAAKAASAAAAAARVLLVIIVSVTVAHEK